MKKIVLSSTNSNDELIVKKLQVYFPSKQFLFCLEKEEVSLSKKGDEASIVPLSEVWDILQENEDVHTFSISQKESPIPFFDEKVQKVVLYSRESQFWSSIASLFKKPLVLYPRDDISQKITREMLCNLQRATVVFTEEKLATDLYELTGPNCRIEYLSTDLEENLKRVSLAHYAAEFVVLISDDLKLQDDLKQRNLLWESTPLLPLYNQKISIECVQQDYSYYCAIVEYLGGTCIEENKADTHISASAEVSISSKLYSLALRMINKELQGEVKDITYLERKKPSLMIQGTCSNAGKSVLTAAFGRILFQDGYAVAPFKAQNMALNSYVTLDGREMGRAQAVQAQACKLLPDVRMNPLLLKPTKDTGSQVVLMGKPVGNLSSKEFISDGKMRLFSTITEAYDSLQDEYDVTVIEGAGSPGEVNLKESDIVNMRMARYAQSPVLLAGDIDRGGIYASFLGTYNTFNFYEKELLRGFLINRFRGDASLLKPADEYIFHQTGREVLGTIPFVPNLNIPEEDCFFFDLYNPSEKRKETLDVAIIGLPHISNSTDFTPLEHEPDISLRPVFTSDEFGDPDVVIIPGSKSVIADLKVIRNLGLEDKILTAVERGTFCIGICGGLQMVGETIADPDAIETEERKITGMKLLPLHTVMKKNKQLSQTIAKELSDGGTLNGYEIHHGITECTNEDIVSQFSEDGRIVGYAHKNIWTSYLHGVFDDDLFRRKFINEIKVKRNMKPLQGVQYTYDIESSLNRLADVVRESVDLKKIYNIMGL